MPGFSPFERKAKGGREQPSPRPLHLRRPVIGRGNDYSGSAVGVGGRRGPAEGDAVAAEVRGSAALRAVDGGGMEREGSGGGGGSAGLLQQILSLKLVPRVGNGTLCPNSTSLCAFPGTPRPAPAHCAPVAGHPGRGRGSSGIAPGCLGPSPVLW